MNLLALVPLPYRILALVALALACLGFGWVKGAAHGQAKIDAMVSHAAVEGVRIVTVRGAVTTRIETKYLPAIARAEVVTETIVKEVPVYVSIADPDLSAGFRVYHDAAAAGRVPDPADIPHAAAVPAPAAAATIAANYGTCTANAIRLQGLQEWIAEQLKVR